MCPPITTKISPDTAKCPMAGRGEQKPLLVENHCSKSCFEPHLMMLSLLEWGSWIFSSANAQYTLLAWRRAELRQSWELEPPFHQALSELTLQPLAFPLSRCFQLLIMNSASSTRFQYVRTSQFSQDMKWWPQSRLKRKRQVGMVLLLMAGS